MFYIYADGESIYDPTLESYQLFEPKLKLEFGKAGSLEFTIPHTNVYFNSLKQLKSIIVVTMDDEELFRGRVLSIENNIQNFKTIYCEGNLAYLVDSVQKGEKYTGKTRALFNKIISAHNAMVENYKRFTVGNVTIDNRDIIITGKSDDNDNINVDNFDYKQIAIDSIADEWNNTFDYIQTCLVDYCGGYLVTRYENGTNYIDYLKNNTGTAAQRIVFGENMLDLTEEVNADELFTVLIPLGDENLTIKDVNDGSVELSDSAAVSQYGRIVRTHVFSNVNDPHTLLENAKRYMETSLERHTTITVRAIDMHLIDDAIDSIRIGNKVRVIAKPHDISKNLVCTEIEYDLANPENNTYTFGNPKQTLTQRYREDKRKQNDIYGNGNSGGAGGVGSAIASAGNSGWHLVKEKTDEKIDDELEKKVKEWNDINPNNPDGIGSLGGLYEYIKGHEKILNQVGIDFNAPQDNISLYALKTVTDTLTGNVESYRAESTSAVKEINGTLTAVQSMVATYKNGTDSKIASWEVRANELGTEIHGIADKMIVEADLIQLGNSVTKDIEDAVTGIKSKIRKSVGINIDVENNTYNLKNIKQTLDEQGRLLTSQGNTITSVVTDTASKLSLMSRSVEGTNKKVAEIEIKTTKNSSDILLKADKTTVNGDLKVINGTLTALEADIENLKAVKITADEIAAALGVINRLGVLNLSASSISSPSINISSEGGESYPVATQAFVSASINSIKNGGDLGLHYHEMTENVAAGTITLGKPTSSPSTFNIRATKTYKEGVAAAERSATIDDISLDSSQVETEITFNETTKILSFYKSASAKNGNLVIYTKDPIQVNVSASKAYTAGLRKGQESQETAINAAINAVTVTLSGTPGSYNTTSKTIPLTVTATLSSGHNTATKSYNINCTDAFNAGRNDVKILSSGVTLVSETYNDNTHTTTLTIKSTADNNATINKSFTTKTTAWDKGVDSGYTTGWNAVGIDASKIASGSLTHYLSYHYTMVKVTAEAKNGKKATQDIKVDTLTHYNYGVMKGGQTALNAVQLNSVVKRSVSGNTEYFNSSTHTTTVYLTSSAKSSDANYSSWSISKNDSVTTGTTAWDESRKYYEPTQITKTDGTQAVNSNTKEINKTITVYAKNAAGTSLKSEVLVVKAAGKSIWDSVTVGSIEIGNVSHGSTASEVTDSKGVKCAHYIDIPLSVSAVNGKSSSRTIRISADKEYSDGYTSHGATKITIGTNGTVSLGKNASGTTDSFGITCNRYYRVPVRADSNDGANVEKTIYVSTDGEYYNGWNARENECGVSSISTNGSVSLGKSTNGVTDSFGTYCYRYHRVPVKATGKNGDVITKTIYVSTDDEYYNGWNARGSDADSVDIDRFWIDDLTYNYYADKYEGHIYIYLSNGNGGRYPFMYP